MLESVVLLLLLRFVDREYLFSMVYRRFMNGRRPRRRRVPRYGYPLVRVYQRGGSPPRRFLLRGYLYYRLVFGNQSRDLVGYSLLLKYLYMPRFLALYSKVSERLSRRARSLALWETHHHLFCCWEFLPLMQREADDLWRAHVVYS